MVLDCAVCDVCVQNILANLPSRSLGTNLENTFKFIDTCFCCAHSSIRLLSILLLHLWRKSILHRTMHAAREQTIKTVDFHYFCYTFDATQFFLPIFIALTCYSLCSSWGLSELTSNTKNTGFQFRAVSFSNDEDVNDGNRVDCSKYQSQNTETR